jgi:aryl-alcohol dehydrogenase
MQIKAAIMEKKGGNFRIVDMELDPPKTNEVLVKIAACGVCHTDEASRQQLLPVPLPVVLGHEGCGVVEEVGPGVTDFKPGDRVGFSFSYCGKFAPCMTGHPYACYDNRRLNFDSVCHDGTKRLHYKGQDVGAFFGQGAFATHAVVHVNNLVHSPDDMPLELVAPMGCGIQTGAGTIFNYVRPDAGSSILITGCGAVGLSAVMAAKIAGCGTIIACDIVPSRLQLAKEMGATHIINSKEVESVEEECRRITNGPGVDCAVDCTGSGKCLRVSLHCTKPLGLCVNVGATQEFTIMVDAELMGLCKTLGSVVEGRCIPQLFIPKLIEMYKKGIFPFDRMIRYYPFREINQAFRDTLGGEVIKAVLVMDDAFFAEKR